MTQLSVRGVPQKWPFRGTGRDPNLEMADGNCDLKESEEHIRDPGQPRRRTIWAPLDTQRLQES